MRIPAFPIPWCTSSIVALVVLSTSACDSAPVQPTEPTAALSLPLNATIESRFVNLVTMAPRVAVTITVTKVEIRERLQSGSSPDYRLELFSPDASAPSRHGFRSLSRYRAPRLDETMPCKLKPGVYAIVEPSSGTVVGILIVYPDCRMEVFTD